MSSAKLSPDLVAAMSPAPEAASPGDAVREAREYVANHQGAQIAMGAGDSMMPLYKDNTVLVVEKRPMSELKPGMTIVFNSEAGWSVAHALVAKTADGWVTMGLNNGETDDRLVTAQNYVGVVVKAYELSVNPLLALARGLSDSGQGYAAVKVPSGNLMASNP